MSVSTLAEYQARLAGMPQESFIGTVCWFSIIAARVKHEQLQTLFQQLGLDERFLPKPIKPIDAFRKATTETKLEYPMPWVDSESKARIMVREVTAAEEMVTRHIVRENVDAKGKTLSYDKIGEAVFYRPSRQQRRNGTIGGERIRIQLMGTYPDVEMEQLRKATEDMKARYHEMCAFLDSNAIRAIVRNYVVDLNAISVKASGGVYFVHKSRQVELDKLRKFVQQIGSNFHTLPLVDTEEQREMLSDAFQNEVEDEVGALLKDIAAINEKHKDGVPAAKYKEISTRFSTVVERSEEYTGLLGLAQERAAAALELAMMSQADMAGRVMER